jgi:hypothetical protein
MQKNHILMSWLIPLPSKTISHRKNQMNHRSDKGERIDV